MNTKWHMDGHIWRDTPDGRKQATVHHLKCDPAQFDAVVSRKKRAEYRRYDDRNFHVYDILVLYKLNSNGDVEEYSPRHAVEILHITTGEKFGIPSGYGVLSIETFNLDLRHADD